MPRRETLPAQLKAEALAARAARALARPGAWLAVEGRGAYAVRSGADRRRRPRLHLGEAEFTLLCGGPGLRRRAAGGWLLAGPPAAEAAATVGPSILPGERSFREEGTLVRRRANLGESPLQWLARRRDADGQPWLTAVQVACGERLREDYVRAGHLGQLTMGWDALPAGTGERLEPAERARAAKARLAAALAAAGPGRALLEQVCLAGSALQAAERELGLRRRGGKHLLRDALQRLAAHYGVG